MMEKAKAEQLRPMQQEPSRQSTGYSPVTQKQIRTSGASESPALLPWLIIATGHMNYPYLFHFPKKSKQETGNYNMQTEISG